MKSIQEVTRSINSENKGAQVVASFDYLGDYFFKLKNIHNGEIFFTCLSKEGTFEISESFF